MHYEFEDITSVDGRIWREELLIAQQKRVEDTPNGLTFSMLEVLGGCQFVWCLSDAQLNVCLKWEEIPIIQIISAISLLKRALCGRTILRH